MKVTDLTLGQLMFTLAHENIAQANQRAAELANTIVFEAYWANPNQHVVITEKAPPMTVNSLVTNPAGETLSVEYTSITPIQRMWGRVDQQARSVSLEELGCMKFILTEAHDSPPSYERKHIYIHALKALVTYGFSRGCYLLITRGENGEHQQTATNRLHQLLDLPQSWG